MFQTRDSEPIRWLLGYVTEKQIIDAYQEGELTQEQFRRINDVCDWWREDLLTELER